MMIEHHSGKKFYMAKSLVHELNIALDVCRQDDDFVIVVDGKEGAGKSKLVRQIGYYLAKNSNFEFSLDNIHFASDPYQESSEKSDIVGWVNVLDESRSSLNKKRSMSKANVQFTTYFSECRDKNQIHIIVLPAYHDLDDYIALWRAKLIIHVLKSFKEDEKAETLSKLTLDRGQYVLFNPDQMQTYYQKSTKFGKYAYPTWRKEQIYYFNDFEVLDDVESYKQKKATWRDKKREEQGTGTGTTIERRDFCLYRMVAWARYEKEVTTRELCRILDMRQSTIDLWLAKWRQIETHFINKNDPNNKYELKIRTNGNKSKIILGGSNE